MINKRQIGMAAVACLVLVFSLSAQYQNSVTPPDWAIGSFTGQTSYGPQITITIDRNGTVTSQIEANTARGVFTRGNWAEFDTVKVQVTRSGNAIETFNPASGERVVYTRNGRYGRNDRNDGPVYGGSGSEGIGQPGVTVYEDRDSRGRSQTFGEGRYLNAGGQMGELRNDKATSVVVLRGYHVRLCDSEGSDGLGSGRCEDYGPGSYNLRYSNTASFIEVTRDGYGGNNSGGNYPGGNYPGGGGRYSEPVNVNDLAGQRTATADAQMRSRGFQNVNTFHANGGNFALWWRSQSRQCIQVGLSRGRYSTLTDVGNDSRCR